MAKENNPRKKTAGLPQENADIAKLALARQGLAIFIITFLLSLSATLGYLLVQTMKEYQAEQAQKAKVETKFSYWQYVVEHNPKFPPGYYQAAIYALRLGKKEKAIQWLDKAIELDPNFNEAERLLEKIEGK